MTNVPPTILFSYPFDDSLGQLRIVVTFFYLNLWEIYANNVPLGREKEQISRYLRPSVQLVREARGRKAIHSCQ